MAGTAHAQDEGCLVERAIPGSVPLLLAKEARLTNANTYGAAATVERRILPELQAATPKAWNDWDHGGFVFYVGGDVLYDVLDVPVTFKGCAAPAGTAPADLSSYNMGFGFRTGAFSFFYTGGANAAFISESSFGRAAFTLANLFVGHYYNVAAPAIGAGRFTLVKDGVSSIGVDYIAGMGVDLDWLDATVGFVGSTGAYVTVDQLDLKLFGRSLIQKLGQDTLELTYLKAGKEAFDWWNEGGAQGETTVYARKLRLPLPDSGDLRDAAYELALEQLDLWTAHIAQRDILSYFDLEASYAFLPVSQVHEARLSFHTPGYNKVSRLSSVNANHETLWPIEAAAYIGMVQIPRMSFYQIEGGEQLALGADIAFVGYSKSANLENSVIRLQIWRNDPTILDIFPYAVGAWQVHLSFQAATFAD